VTILLLPDEFEKAGFYRLYRISQNRITILWEKLTKIEQAALKEIFKKPFQILKYSEAGINELPVWIG
jgi:hypothetical protein